MPEYLSPGVYIEEIDAGPKPIEGVSTSTAGAVGVTARGPTDGKPVLITSFADFVRKFGGFLPEPEGALYNKWAANPGDGGRWWQFPLAVKSFFDNGGQRLYVKRAVSRNALASSEQAVQGVAARLKADARADATQITLTHLIGIQEGKAIAIKRGDNGNKVDDYQVTAYDPTSRKVTLNKQAGEELLAQRGDFVEIHAIDATKKTLAFEAKAKGKWGDALSVRVQPMVGRTLRILNDPSIAGDAVSTTVVQTTVDAGPPLKTTVEVADVTGLSDDDHIEVNGNEYVISNLDAPNKKFEITPSLEAGQSWPAGTLVRRLRPANNAAAPAPTIYAWGAARLYPGAIVELDNGKEKESSTVQSTEGDKITLSSNLAKAYFEGHAIRVIEAEVAARYAPGGVVEAEESFSNLRLKNDGSLSYLPKHIETRSELIKATVLSGAAGDFSDSDLAKFPVAPNGSWLKLENGNDHLDQLTSDDFVGEDGGSGKRTGVQALEDIDQVSICLCPGLWSSIVHSALIQHCEILKDRFAILDPQDGLSIEKIQQVRAPIDTKYAALYYPWLEVRDPSVRRNVLAAPSGHMAGIYARVDVERGVHKAPANEVIRGITKIAQDVTKREQDILNPQGINALRFFPGRGNRVWGARTVSSDGSWKYINVRRLFIFVEESIEEGTQWVVFEPNDEPLWARVRQSVTNFLTTVWRSGALQGLTAKEAFFVKCDRTTMTQDDIDNGRLICVIGIAPVKPAEFVIFRIQQKTLEAQET